MDSILRTIKKMIGGVDDDSFTGFDTDLISAIDRVVNVPVISSGGYGVPGHLSQVVAAGADAVAFADCLHYERATVPALRDAARSAGISVREI